MDQAFRLVYGLAIAVLLALFAISIAGLLDATVVWDDSYMFVRYADHFLAGQGVSWNPGEGPVYGLTSLGYFLVIVVFRALLPGQAALTAMLASLSGALVFIILMVILLGRAVPACGKAKQVIGFFIIGSLGLSIDSWRVHCLGGMDTTFALAWLTLYLLIAKWRQQAPGPAGAVMMGIVGGLTYWARPDLCLYAGLIPLSMLILERDRRARKLSLLTLVITGALTGGLMLFSAWYFQTALPLPFYAKSMSRYGAFFVRQYRFHPIEELLNFISSYWYFFVLIGIDLGLNPRSWLKKEYAVETGALAATIVFIIYYLFFVLQIMHFRFRFYMPALPALMLLAAKSAVGLLERLEREALGEGRKVPEFAWVVFLLFMTGAFFPRGVAESRFGVKAWSGPDYGSRSVVNQYRKRWTKVWVGLEEFSALPDDFTFATTEVGLLGVMNPNKRVIDLAGLHDLNFVRQGFSAARLFKNDQPDLVYIPHWHYKWMIDQMLESEEFKRGYDYYPAEAIGAQMGLALNKQSKYYGRMKEIVLKYGKTRP